MPATYRVFRDGSLVIERWGGRITHAALVRHLMGRLNDDAIKPNATVLADGRSAIFETAEELAPLAADTRSPVDPISNEEKVAMVVNRDALVRANLFAARAAEKGVKIMVFEHLDVACLWLDISPEEATRLLDEVDRPPEHAGKSKSG